MTRLQETVTSISLKQTGTYPICKANAAIHDQTSRGSVVVSQLEVGLCLFMESSILCCLGSTRNGLSVCDRIAVTCSCQGCDTGRHLGKVLNLEGWSKRCWCNRWQQFSRWKASTPRYDNETDVCCHGASQTGSYLDARP
jgi:hypothetical protein